MPDLYNLDDFLNEQVKRLYNGEKTQMEWLSKVKLRTNARQLRQFIDQRFEEKKNAVYRLEKVLDQLGEERYGEHNTMIDRLIEDGGRLLDRSSDPEMEDTVIITSFQRIGHYLMAVYGSLRAYAIALEKEETAALLNEALEEEKKADRRLTEIAVNSLNKKAVNPV